MFKAWKNQFGITNLLIAAIVGVVLFILVTASFSFKNIIFQRLFPKPFSQASSNPISNPVSSGVTLTLAPSTSTFRKSCDYALSIYMDAKSYSILGTDIVLLYNPNIISVKTFNFSGYPNGYFYTNIDNVSGRLVATGPAPGTQGSSRYATLSLNIKANTTASSAAILFDYDPSNPYKTTDTNVVENYTVSDLLTGVSNGNYFITTGPCSGAADVNLNGMVDLFDLSIILSNYNKTNPNTQADINKDGAVNAFDVSFFISQYLLQ